MLISLHMINTLKNQIRTEDFKPQMEFDSFKLLQYSII